MAIERYLALLDSISSKRPNLIERIRLLGRGSGLAQFRWNSTSKLSDTVSSSHSNHNGISSNVGGLSGARQQGLTDAQLVITLFCGFLDEKLPGEGYGISPLHPFTSKYFIDASSVSKTNSKKICDCFLFYHFLLEHVLSGIKIRQASKFPPHYQLMIDNVVYDIATVLS